MSERSRFWSLTAIEGPTQYAGNTGYEDDAEAVYRYDSWVGNHQQLGEGDFIVLKNRERALGVAVIERIESDPATKTVRRCPDCKSTRIKQRVSKEPEWRYSQCRSEFDDPDSAEADVMAFQAHYAATFIPLSNGLTSAEIKKAAIRPNDQMSIEEINPRLIDWSHVPERVQVVDLIHSCLHRNYAVPENRDNGRPDDDSDQSGDFVSDHAEKREHTLREISLRRGQARFRGSLQKRYSGSCVISGCRVTAALKAAHIRGNQARFGGTSLSIYSAARAVSASAVGCGFRPTKYSRL